MFNPEELFKMEIHDKLRIDGSTEIMRVPDGWLYTLEFWKPSQCEGGRELTHVTTTFVPYCEALEI